MDKIEQVARAIATSLEVSPESWRDHCDEASAAIEAMLEPTQQQMTEGYQFLLSDSSKNGYGNRTDEQKMERMRGYYRAMIKAALTKEPSLARTYAQDWETKLDAAKP